MQPKVKINGKAFDLSSVSFIEGDIAHISYENEDDQTEVLFYNRYTGIWSDVDDKSFKVELGEMQHA